MNSVIKVAHIWGDFHPSLFANPHNYLLHKEGWDSCTFSSKLVCKDSNITFEKLYAYKNSTLKEVNNGSIINRIKLKIQSKFIWSKYNKWIEKNEAFKGASVIHAHFGQMGVHVLELVKKTKLPLIVSFYGVDGSMLLQEPKWVAAYKEMFAYTNYAIVLCQEVKDRLMKIGLEEKKIIIWRIPIELKIYKYRQRQYDSKKVKFIIGARFVEKKGYPFLIEAFDRMVKEGKNVYLTMIGYGGEKVKVDAEIKLRGIENYTQTVDTKLQGDFANFFNRELQKNDIFVLPSIKASTGDDEGGPALTLVAAQAAGLPVICTAFPGAEISVFENKTGIFCEYNNAESLYDKMLYLYNNNTRWNELGLAASEYVNKAFDETHQMEEMISIYKSAL